MNEMENRIKRTKKWTVAATTEKKKRQRINQGPLSPLLWSSHWKRTHTPTHRHFIQFNTHSFLQFLAITNKAPVLNCWMIFVCNSRYKYNIRLWSAFQVKSLNSWLLCFFFFRLSYVQSADISRLFCCHEQFVVVAVDLLCKKFIQALFDLYRPKNRCMPNATVVLPSVGWMRGWHLP